MELHKFQGDIYGDNHNKRSIFMYQLFFLNILKNKFISLLYFSYIIDLKRTILKICVICISGPSLKVMLKGAQVCIEFHLQIKVVKR